VEGGRLREQEEQSCVLMMSHVLPPDRAHSKKTEAQALLPIASNHKGERELDSVFYQKERRKKSFFPMTFSPFTFDVSHLFCLFNSIRLSIFHQKVHQIRKLAHYYHHTCLSTEHNKSCSIRLLLFFCFLFIFPGKEGTNETEEVVQVEPQKNVCVWESRKRRRRSYETNETRKALTQK
jgi:hypothetical protein